MATPAFTSTSALPLSPAPEVKWWLEESAIASTTASAASAAPKENPTRPASPDLPANHIQDVLKYHTANVPIYPEILKEIYSCITSEDPLEAIRSLVKSKKEAIQKKKTDELMQQYPFIKDTHGYWRSYGKIDGQIAGEHIVNLYFIHALLMAIRLGKPMTVITGLYYETNNPGKYPLLFVASEFSSLDYLLALTGIMDGFSKTYLFKPTNCDKSFSLSFSPTMWTAKCGRLDMLKEKLKILPTLSNTLYPYFIAAAAGGAISTMEYLLSLDKSLISEKEKGSWANAFMVAAYYGQISSLKFIAKYAKENLGIEIWKSVTSLDATVAEGLNAFMCAVYGGSIETLEFMRKEYHEHFWKQPCLNGDNAFMIATRANQIKCMEYLLTLDRDFAQKTNTAGCNAFLAGDNYTNENTLLFLKKLNPALINSRDTNGENALFKAVKGMWPDRIYLLIKHGVKIGMPTNEKDNEKNTLEKNKWRNHHFTHRVQHLIQAIEQAFDAVKTGQFKKLQELLAARYCLSEIEYPFPINCRDNTGKTLLHYACEEMRHDEAHLLEPSKKIALFLIEQGIARNIQDDLGITYIHEILYKQKKMQFVLDAYKLLAKNIVQDAALSDQDKQIKAKSLHEEFSRIFEDAVKDRVFNPQNIHDYDYLVSTFGKQYWVLFADYWSRVNEVDIWQRSLSHPKHEKLAILIRTGTIKCKEIKKGISQFLEFELGNVDLTGESAKERNVRLRNALKFAMRAHSIDLMIELSWAISRTAEEESLTDFIKIKKNLKYLCALEGLDYEKDSLLAYEHLQFLLQSGQGDTLHRKDLAVEYVEAGSAKESAKEVAERAGERGSFDCKLQAAKAVLSLDENEANEREVEYAIADEAEGAGAAKGSCKESGKESSKVKASPAKKP